MNFEQIKKYLPWGAVGVPVVLAIVVFIFGLVNAQNINEAINQHFYYTMANMSVDGNVISIDLSEVSKNKLDCHNDVMMISFKKEISPKFCEGGEIELYQEKSDFVTYKIKHTADLVKITV